MCRYTIEDIERYFVNAMSDSEELDFQEHLLQCADCRRQLEELRRLSSALIDEDEEISVVREVPFVLRYRKLFAAASVVLVFAVGVAVALLGGRQDIAVPGGGFEGTFAVSDTSNTTLGSDSVSDAVLPAKEDIKPHFTQKKPAKPAEKPSDEEEEMYLMFDFDEPVHYAKQDTFTDE